MNEKERIIKVLNKEKVDRPPCICPGGMMNMITTELMHKVNLLWPVAHIDSDIMAKLAFESFNNGGFENVGVPFCMTVEAESFGAKVFMGSNKVEPHIEQYAIQSVLDYKNLSIPDCHTGRMEVVLQAIKKLKEMNLTVPIIGNITGPISVASQVVNPVNFYQDLMKHKQESKEYLDLITKHIINFAIAQVEAGADIITISDPSGTGEIMGPKLFEEWAVKYINQIIDALKKYDIKIIVHICGQLKIVYDGVNKINCDAISFDAIVPMNIAREKFLDKILMGNVSTYAIEFGTEEKIGDLVKFCASNGADIIAPACGIGTGSPLKNVQAMVNATKKLR